MFITLTIDTTVAKTRKVKLNKSRINPASGWRKTIHTKKRSLRQKFNAWKRSIGEKQYTLNGQAAMF